jgi:hypothetical protein
MPWDSTPRSFAALIAKSPGSVAPTVASGAFSPTRAFGAPQTICSSRRRRPRRCTPQLVRIRVRLGAMISPTTTPAEVAGHRLHRVHLEARHGDLVRQFLGC